jgi:hypothetical protein
MADLYYIQKTNTKGEINLLPNVFFEADIAQLHLDEYKQKHPKIKLEIIVVAGERKPLVNSNPHVDALTRGATHNEKLAINTILSVLGNEHVVRRDVIKTASKKSRLPQMFIANVLDTYNDVDFFWRLVRVHNFARKRYIRDFPEQV